jgi:DNA-binding PadR family transcriptional regulator
VPFYKSKPSKYLAIMLLSVISFAIIVPYTPVGEFFQFTPPPPAFYLALAGILGAYAVLAETVKRFFYKRYGHRVEQVLVPKRKTIYFTKTAKFMQDMVAVISLRFEDEISIDSLTEDLNSAITYPINPNQVIQNLQHLRRAGLISVDWQKRTIKREKPMKEYVRKNIVASETWPNIIEDWNKISDTIQDKYGKVNTEYQGMLNPKQP